MSRYLTHFNEDVIRKVIFAYLYEARSHRQIQKEILHLPAPARGGGFVAMDILHYFSIDVGKKGVLKTRSIEDEMKTSDVAYTNALKKIM